MELWKEKRFFYSFAIQMYIGSAEFNYFCCISLINPTNIMNTPKGRNLCQNKTKQSGDLLWLDFKLCINVEFCNKEGQNCLKTAFFLSNSCGFNLIIEYKDMLLAVGKFSNVQLYVIKSLYRRFSLQRQSGG